MKGGRSMSFEGSCPVCDAHVPVPKDSEVSEIVSCHECKGRLVVESISEKHVVLNKAPDIEEDWGE